MSNNHYQQNLGSMWHLIYSGYLSYPLFLQKGKFGNHFEVSTFGGSLFPEGSLLSGFANTCDILSLLSRGRYFRNFAVSLKQNSWMLYLYIIFTYLNSYKSVDRSLLMDKFGIKLLELKTLLINRTLQRNSRKKQITGAPHENIVQNHLNMALLNVF